jgi:hypothetical protein
MEGGMFVDKHFHLDEQACNVHLIIVQPFPHGVRTRTSWSRALLFAYAW